MVSYTYIIKSKLYQWRKEMPENSKKVYDKEMITQLRDVERSIVESTLTEEEKQFAQEAEKSSVRFLEGYVKGEIVLADDAYDIMVNYLDYLSKSELPEIAQNLTAAQNTYMSARYAKRKQKQQQEIIQSVGEIDLEALRKNNFSILDNKKKREALSSAHLIEMETMMREDKDSNMSKRMQMLRSYAINRIDSVLSGKRERDDDFNQLVQIFGTPKQKETNRKITSKSQSETIIEPTTSNAEKIVIEEPQVIKSEEDKNLKSQPQKKSFREINKEKHERKPKTDNAEYPTPEQFAILQDKKRAKDLSAAELIELSNMLEQVKKAPKKHQFKTDKIENTLRSYTQNLMVKIRTGNAIATDDAAQLALRYAPQQLESVRKQQAKQEDRVIILPPIDDNKKQDDKPEKSEKNEKDTEKKPKKASVKKDPWYKKAWNTIKKPAVALATVLVIAASSFAIKGALGSDNKSDKDDAKKPQTENVTKTDNKKQTDEKIKVITTEEISQEVQKTKEKIQNTTQSTQVQHVSEGGIDYARRTTTFLKTITGYNKIVKEDANLAEKNLKDAQDKLNKFVDSIKDKLPEGVSAERMAYLASFHRLFPNDEFGKKMTKVFNGEEVSISKEDIAKLNQAHGQLGKKYINSLQTMKANTGR